MDFHGFWWISTDFNGSGWISIDFDGFSGILKRREEKKEGTSNNEFKKHADGFSTWWNVIGEKNLMIVRSYFGSSFKIVW